MKQLTNIIFYELIIIIRQDVSSIEVDKITKDLIQILENNQGEIIKTEYWGLKQLAYQVGNNKKGHYCFLGLKATTATLKQLQHKIKLSESIIRSSIIKVDEIEQEPSALLKNKNDDGKTIEVTVNTTSKHNSKDN
jgi:small subunit ribosomal protein S6